jgi:hypothetical protein
VGRRAADHPLSRRGERVPVHPARSRGRDPALELPARDRSSPETPWC